MNVYCVSAVLQMNLRVSLFPLWDSDFFPYFFCGRGEALELLLFARDNSRLYTTTQIQRDRLHNVMGRGRKSNIRSLSPVVRGQRVLSETRDGKLNATWTPEGRRTASSASKASVSLVRLLRATLLPAGYPACVTADYLNYQLYDAVQGLCSYVRGVFVSHAVLRGLGVGDAGATAASATAAWLLRDLCGHATGLAFGAVAGSRLDGSAKQWRLFADVANDVGLVLSLVSPLTPRRLFLPLLCVSSALSAVTGAAAGATRAALTSHFALRGNTADVAAKEGAQETAVTLLGMLLGWAAVKATAGSPSAAWLLFAALTVLHVVANAAGMRSLHLTTLSVERLAIVTWSNATSPARALLTPAEVARRESLLPGGLFRPRDAAPFRTMCLPRIRIGAPLLARQYGDALNACSSGAMFLVAVDTSFFPGSTIRLSFRCDSPPDTLAATVLLVVRRLAANQPLESMGDLKAWESEWAAFSGRLKSVGWGSIAPLCAIDEGYRFEDGHHA